MELVQIYFKNLNKFAVLPISWHFFCIYLKNFPSWIPIRIHEGKLMRGSGSTALTMGIAVQTEAARIYLRTTTKHFISGEYRCCGAAPASVVLLFRLRHWP